MAVDDINASQQNQRRSVLLVVGAAAVAAASPLRYYVRGIGQLAVGCRPPARPFWLGCRGLWCRQRRRGLRHRYSASGGTRRGPLTRVTCDEAAPSNISSTATYECSKAGRGSCRVDLLWVEAGTKICLLLLFSAADSNCWSRQADKSIEQGLTGYLIVTNAGLTVPGRREERTVSGIVEKNGT